MSGNSQRNEILREVRGVLEDRQHHCQVVWQRSGEHPGCRYGQEYLYLTDLLERAKEVFG